MKLHGKNLLITLILCVVLFTVIGIEIILFISGPSLRYDDKVSSEEAVILENNKDIKNLERHVFAYIMYNGEDDKEMYWFNEKGDYMTKRELSKINKDKAASVALETRGMDQTTVTLGYGRENPVYVISNDQGELLLDIDTMEEVFYRVKG